VVKACLEQRSFRLRSMTMLDDALTGSFTNGTSHDVTINRAFIRPEGIAKCSVFYDGKTIDDISKLQGMQLKANNEVTITCTRESRAQDVVKHYPGGMVGISTQDSTANPVSREFGSESGSHETPPTAIESATFHTPEKAVCPAEYSS
jgi:hypothetical protein